MGLITLDRYRFFNFEYIFIIIELGIMGIMDKLATVIKISECNQHAISGISKAVAARVRQMRQVCQQ